MTDYSLIAVEAVNSDSHSFFFLQAIKWIMELCDITNNATNGSAMRSAQELDAYEREKDQIETTAQVSIEEAFMLDLKLL